METEAPGYVGGGGSAHGVPHRVLRFSSSRNKKQRSAVIYAYDTWEDAWTACLVLLQKQTQTTLLTAVMDVDDTLLLRSGQLAKHGSSILQSVIFSGFEPLFITSRPAKAQKDTARALHEHTMRSAGGSVNPQLVTCMPLSVQQACSREKDARAAQRHVREWKKKERKRLACKYSLLNSVYLSRVTGGYTGVEDDDGRSASSSSSGEVTRVGSTTSSLPVTRKEWATRPPKLQDMHGVCIGDHWRDLTGGSWTGLERHADVRQLAHTHFLVCVGLDRHSYVSIKVPEALVEER